MNFNNYVDYTLLKPNASKKDILDFLEEAKKYNPISVCIFPYWVELARKTLKDTNIKICTVIGFPFGANSTKIKALETDEAINNGANEVDMVINIGAFKSAEYDVVKKDIEKIADITKKRGIVLKVIIETAYLSNDEIKKATEIIVDANANFVKTSTGFASSGAKINDIKIMKSVTSDKIGIKASGGIRTKEEASEFISAGVTRLGTSKMI